MQSFKKWLLFSEIGQQPFPTKPERSPITAMPSIDLTGDDSPPTPSNQIRQQQIIKNIKLKTPIEQVPSNQYMSQSSKFTAKFSKKT